MPVLRVPKAIADDPSSANDRLFPQGVYRFTLLTPTNERVRHLPVAEQPGWMREEPDWGGPSYAGEDITELNVWLGEAEVLDGEDPGKQVFFQSFVVEDGGTSVMDLDLDNPGDVGHGIQRDAPLFVSLAQALGATTEQDGYAVPADNFRDLLEAGTFDGQEVIAEVSHRQNKDKTKTYAVVKSFAAV